MGEKTTRRTQINHGLSLPPQAMTKKPALCKLCLTARDDRLFRNPTHLVHPLTRELMVFDACTEAICPTCGARWRRVLNVVQLVE